MFLSFIITGEYSQALAIFKIHIRPEAGCHLYLIIRYHDTCAQMSDYTYGQVSHDESIRILPDYRANLVIRSDKCQLGTLWP